MIVVQSVTVFNDFVNPLYFLPGDENATVQLTLFNFQSQYEQSYHLLFADILLITIPPLIMFMFFNRQDRRRPDRGRRQGMMRVGVKDVARAAGVSVGTVSNVLNRPEIVRDETRSRVQAEMARLGFVRNESARQLRQGRSRTLAYVFLDATNPFFTDVARGAEAAAEQAGLGAVPVQQQRRPRARGPLPRPAPPAAGARDHDHRARLREPAAADAAAAGHPGGARRPSGRHRERMVQRRGGRHGSAASWPSRT